MFSLEMEEGAWSLPQLSIPDFVDFLSEVLPPLRSGCVFVCVGGMEEMRE